jgi:hypothetical protein
MLVINPDSGGNDGWLDSLYLWHSWQAIQKYFCVRFLPHLFKINNHLYAFSAVGAYEEVVGIEGTRHGGIEGSRHGWSDYRLASLQALRTVMSEGNFG